MIWSSDERHQWRERYADIQQVFGASGFPTLSKFEKSVRNIFLFASAGGIHPHRSGKEGGGALFDGAGAMRSERGAASRLRDGREAQPPRMRGRRSRQAGLFPGTATGRPGRSAAPARLVVV